MNSVIFLCLGNICRSPLAEGLARHRALQRPELGHLRFDSAGTESYHVGEPPDRRAIAVARRHGIDIADLRARQLAEDDFRRFDLILAADRRVLGELRGFRPVDARADVALMLEWCGAGAGREVPDPYYGGDDHFGQVYALLDGAIDGLFARLRAAS